MNLAAPILPPNGAAEAIGELLYAAELPPPLSVNNLFHTTGKFPGSGKKIRARSKTKSYQDWIRGAGQMLVAQGRRPALAGPVAILFTLGDDSRSCKFDTDNAGKAYIDLLVRHGILPDDNRRVVRHLAYTWQPGDRCCAHIYRWGG